MASIDTLSLKDLRAVISEGGLSADGCIDKSDLRTRAREALERLKQPGASVGPVSKPLVAEALEADKELAAELAKKKEAAMLDAAAKRAETDAKFKAEQEAKEREVKEKAAAEKRAEQEADKAAKRAAAAEKAAAAEQAAKGAAQLLDAVAAGDNEQLALLLKTVDPNCKGEEGKTLLHVVAAKGLAEMVATAIAAGADVHAKSDDGQTPLHNAAIFNRIDVAKALIAAGANPLVEDGSTQLPKTYATLNQRTEMAALLGEAEVAQRAKDAAAAAAARQAEADEAARLAANEEATRLVGKQVRIAGLKARPDANGKVGFVLSATGTGRATVAVTSDAGQVEQMNLRPANLEVVE
jgi:hypothetical protein